MNEEKENRSIRLWLSRYKPHFVRCTMADNTQRELAKPQVGRGQWMHMEKLIEQLAPTYIEALNEKRDVINARSLDVEEENAAEPIDTGNEAENPLAAVVKIMPTMVGLVIDACDQAVARHQAAYELAFTKNNELVHMLSTRLGSLERAWHEMILEKAQAAGTDSNDGQALGLLHEVLASRGKNGANGGTKPKEDAE